MFVRRKVTLVNPNLGTVTYARDIHANRIARDLANGWEIVREWDVYRDAAGDWYSRPTDERVERGAVYRLAMSVLAGKPDVPLFDHPRAIGPCEAPFSLPEMAAAYRRYCARPGTLTGRPMFDHPYPLLPGNADGAQEWELSGAALAGPRLGRLTRSELREARSWIADCWESSEVNAARLSRSEVESAIARHYSGGLSEFIRNTNGG
jgi:hypothetical protein